MSEFKINTEFKRTFPWKLAVIFLLFSCVIILMGSFYYRYERNRIFEEQEKSLSSIASLKIKQISQWYSDKVADGVVIKDNEPLVSRIKQFLKDENQTGIRKEIAIWLEALNTQYDYNSVALLDTLSRVRIATSNADPLADESIRKEIKNVIMYHEIIMTDLHKTRNSHAIRMDLLVPLLDPLSAEHKTIGLVILCIDPDKILFPLVQSWPTPSKSSETLILRREGDSVLYLNELRHRRNTALKLKFALSEKNLLASKAVNGFEGVTEGIDYRNISVIGAISKIPGLPWFMVAKTDKEELLAPFETYSFITVFVIILLILINASIFGFWIWQQRIKFYKNQLKNDISIRELEERFTTAFRMSPVSVTISSTADNKFLEINNTFLQDMDYKREDVIGRTAKELDIWADEGEREWIINEIIKKGSVSGKVIRYKTRTGKILYGLSSLSVVKLNGEPCNLSTVVNITESRKSEERLVRSEELFRKLFENMLNGFAYCKMICEEGRPLDVMYLNVNAAFTTLTGLKDVEGKLVSEVIPGIQQTDPELLERYNRVSSTGIPEVFETYVDSLKMWFAISVYCPQTGYFVAVFDVITARKLAEERLMESKATLQSIIDNSNSLIYLVDTEGRFLMVNQPLQKLLLNSGDELVGQTREAFLTKEIADAHRKNDLEVIKSGKTQTFEEENSEPDGKHFYLTTKFPLFNNQKEIYAVGGLSTDITERKIIERTLKESEEKFRKAFLTNPDSIIITRLDDGTYVSVNDGFTKTFEYSEKEVLGKTPFDISIWFDPDDRKHFIKSLQTEGNVGNFETKFYSKSKKLIDCLVSATTINLEGVDHVLSNVRDITERKLVDEALHENEKRLREAQEMAHLGFWIWDIKTGDVEWSEEVYKIFCLDPETFIPKIDSILELSPWPEDHQRDKELIARALEDHTPGEYEQKFLRPDKSIGYYLSTFRGSYDDNNDLISIVGTILDITSRKLSEMALRESEDKFKYVFDHSLIAKSITLPSGEINVNQAFCEMLGYQPEELKKINWTYISHPDDIELTNNSLNSILKGNKETARFTKRYIHKNGSVIWADVGTSLRRDNDNNPQYFMTSVNDITERKAAEEALRESEERFSKSFKTSPISFMIANLEDGRIIEVNDAFVAISKFTHEEVVGNTTLNLKIWVNELDRKDMIDSLSKGKAILHKETRLRAKDGKIATVLLSAQVIKLANRNCIITSIEDITVRKQAEEALRESEERFRSMANSIPQLAWVARADGFIYWYNQRWYEYTGTKPEQMEGWGWQIVHDPAVLPKVMENWTASIASGQFFEMSFPLRGSDGLFRTFLTRVFPMKDSEGRVVQWFGTNTDVEALKQAETIINKLNEELEQKVMQRTELLEAANKELEAFSYSVSHDLRAPLRSVHGFTKILLEDYESKLDDEGKRICGIISSSATQMGELIDDLLSFSRIGRSSMNPLLLDMNSIVHSVFDEICTASQKSKTKLKIGKLHKALGDANLLKIVWTNLISNAIKYSSKEDTSEISISSGLKDHTIAYSIKDNGVGFDMVYKQKLFGVFQRLHSESEFEGNGVGLAIVQRIILKHGGKVWAEGEVGKGATFYFSLPVQEINMKTHDSRHTTHG